MKRSRNPAQEPIVIAIEPLTLSERIADLQEKARASRNSAAMGLGVTAAGAAIAVYGIFERDVDLAVFGAGFFVGGSVGGSREILEALQTGREAAALIGAEAIIDSQPGKVLPPFGSNV